MGFRYVLLGSACVLAFSGLALADEPAVSKAAAAAQQGDAASEPEAGKSVEKITVTATRQKRRADEVPATVSVISAKEIEDSLANDIKDVTRFEPGVSVRSQPARFTAASGVGRDGNSSINIRGLEGNRVLIQVDGIRLPDSFSFGPQAVGRGDYFDLEVLRSVEILRGPASALYGSDGVAGVVSFITKDPDNIIDDGETFAGRARVAYSSADDSWAESALVAAQTRSGQWQGMLAYTRRDAHETETRGENASSNTTRTVANPQDIEANSVFSKLVFAPTDADRFRLTYEYQDRSVGTEVLSARAALPPPAPNSVLDLDGLDETTRNRVSLDHRHTGAGWIKDAFWAVYYQSAETREFSAEDRNISADRTRDSLFDNSIWGATAQLESEFALGEIANSLVYGFEYSRTRQEGLRDGITPPFGETFPTKPFPDTDFMLAGAYIQDEISLLGGQLKLYPAVRFDRYELEPSASPLYPGAIVPQSDEYLSMKFGAIYWPVDAFGIFANFAQGFKAPAPSEVNNGFQNAGAFYSSIPNPNLRPETSESYEGGIRVRDIRAAGGAWAASVTAFAGRYEDFIEQVQIAGNFTPGNPAVFQYINLTEVEISGFEARLDARWEHGFGITAAASATKGDQVVSGVESPLNSIDPWKLVGGLRYDDPEGAFGGQAIVTYSSGKDSDRVNNTPCAPSTSCFVPDGFTIFDMTAYWNMTDRAVLRAGVFNVFDEKYSWWSDVRGLGAPTTVADGYTQPGRNASVSLTYRF